ncbi:cyclic pyranopterin monophosphate synthase MoaC [Psychrobacillus psychrodurans]|uniref:cyclic pyranopterin monophosphate synthase MoaC n=1 Tax=Psychrobacillus psychrodurans TaxID=126157 RepID=UPI0008EA4CB4|nr:cyclic pyranopterin monophosphate synthase MoaC [Psychrobacillus psychrodurans]MCZ8540007.1 cyclic pyranopterin monophosphate synthase MoaC [Psychrobacillus psychrodurans]SFM52268.1 cyclic pyranopterin phosphate synthase [Psychrobacillus psychrodurans]
MSELTHFNEQGRAKMVDISDKNETTRTAVAVSSITVNDTIKSQITDGTNKKGDVFAVAQVAGIMAAKNTSTMIPMCHPIFLSGINITFEWSSNEENVINIQSEVKTIGSTGVEMEALVAASAAALTIYDMCKAGGKDMVIGSTMLVSKTGGKNGDYQRETSV